MEHLSNQPDRNTNLLSIVLVGILLILWCLLSINPTANVHAIQIVETVIIALLIAISAYSMGDGSRNFGIAGIIIGLSLSYIPFYLSLTLPAAVFLEQSTQTVITLLSAASGGIALFSTVVLGLWISPHIPNKYRSLSKYLAFALAIAAPASPCQPKTETFPSQPIDLFHQ